MQQTPGLFARIPEWAQALYPEFAILVGTIGLICLVGLVVVAVRYAREVRGRSPFEPL